MILQGGTNGEEIKGATGEIHTFPTKMAEMLTFKPFNFLSFFLDWSKQQLQTAMQFEI